MAVKLNCIDKQATQGQMILGEDISGHIPLQSLCSTLSGS